MCWLVRLRYHELQPRALLGGWVCCLNRFSVLFSAASEIPAGDRSKSRVVDGVMLLNTARDLGPEALLQHATGQ